MFSGRAKILFYFVFVLFSVSAIAQNCPQSLALLPREEEDRSIVLLGAPGVGKGTLARNLLARLKLLHFSPGDILRLERDSGSDLGQQAAPYLADGRLVPWEIMDAVLKKFFKRADKRFGILLDGSPRKFDQVAQTEELLKGDNRRVDIVFEVYGDRAATIQRLEGRLICPKCQRTYHIVHLPSLVPGVCDFDQQILERRKDDNPDTINGRWEKFGLETVPVIEMYRKRGIVYSVNGDKTPQSLTDEVLQILAFTRRPR